jgi:hypothetical protein
MSAQLMPVSPTAHCEVEETMRTAPVVELVQTETFVDTGAAMAAVPTKKRDTSAARDLQADIQNLQGEFWGNSQPFS